MTEYDYSPEAIDAYLRKQQQIARWADNTARAPYRDPYTPATPAEALHTRPLDQDPYPEDTTHRRHVSPDRRDRHRDREHKDRERGHSEREHARRGSRDRSERDSSHRERASDRHSSKTTPSKRHRSASHSAPTTQRPDPQRSYTVPPPLPLPPFPQPNMAAYPNTNGYPPYGHAPKLANPRDSRHSSRSSSTTRIPQQPSPTSYYPQQPPPWSAPVFGSMRPPHRSQTTPIYAYPPDAKYPSTANVYYKDPLVYPNMSPPKKQPYDWAVRSSPSSLTLS
ncbi:hypothetical protein BDN70DRAFT_24187 [Pholiota conissans]|uniref:Uncharacterized protein n=1 Tax=Pholiota conissans TaxID=109636 RepID=A0A9P5ZFC8_9AGAR|nr:hypothetical protein BDN70DRAFT_24187 [Pholiota conissans]